MRIWEVPALRNRANDVWGDDVKTMRVAGIFACVLGVVALLLGARGAVAQDAVAGKRVVWLSGAELNRQLQRPLSGVWSQQTLRRAMANLGRENRVAIFLDRRVDPDRKLKFSLQKRPLIDIVSYVAQQRGAEACVLDSIVYVGPAEVTARLRTLAALRKLNVEKLPADAQRRLFARTAWRWDDLATPRELLAALEKSTGLRIADQERVPHDLWAAASLPPLRAIDRLTLVAAAFDLTFAIEQGGSVLRLVPIPDKVVLVRDYPLGRRKRAVVTSWAEQMPSSRIIVRDKKIYLEGPLEAHEQLAAMLQGRKTPRPKPAAGKVLLTAKVDGQPVGPLIRAICKQKDLEVEFDTEAIEKAELSLDKTVSFSVQRVSLDQLLAAALKPAGLAHQRSGKLVRVGPAK